jgi:hypothetical protein
MQKTLTIAESGMMTRDGNVGAHLAGLYGEGQSQQSRTEANLSKMPGTQPKKKVIQAVS